MAAPICRNVGKILEAMWDAVVDLFFVWVGFIVRLADALGDHFRIAFTMARVLAIGTLHACSILQEVPAKRAAHNVVELLCDELVALLLVDLFLLLTDCALSVQAVVEWTAILQLLRCESVSLSSHRSRSGDQKEKKKKPTEAHRQMNSAKRF